MLNKINLTKSAKESQFYAKPLPQFSFKEIKKSSNKLTIPASPKLKTKSRSVSKLKNMC